ncbi:embryo defective 1303 [Striga hermonthica]|uniref:Embryo defective 1303 n=1 Tax=Striga hermonthica TaxID=68872 RepID=A0A9N7RJX2_STRHE|nr:embryo defective 1303 [Striga hermonthica]
MSLSAMMASSIALQPTVGLSRPVRPKPLCTQFSFGRSKAHAIQVKRAFVICSAAEQTQTITRKSSTITVAPIQGKEKSPELDDGGAGFPPRDDGGGGGGGGGGGWTGGFFFFAFLALLGLLRDEEGLARSRWSSGLALERAMLVSAKGSRACGDTRNSSGPYQPQSLLLSLVVFVGDKLRYDLIGD